LPTSSASASSLGNAEGYAATFSVARPIFHVVGHSHHDEVAITKAGAWPHMTAQIWPILGFAHWPPRIIVDDDGLLTIARTWDTT
jgi:hypothetical protein